MNHKKPFIFSYSLQWVIEGANCCIPVEIEEILTYTQIKNAETFAVGQSCVANSPCTLSTNLDWL